MFYSYETTISASVTLATLDDTHLVFKVKAESDVHLQLSRYQGITSIDTYEIVIGGYNNSKSAVRDSVQGGNECEKETAGILSATEFRYFWVSWKDGTIAFGRHNVVGSSTICSWKDVLPHEVSGIKFLTETGYRGTWDISETSGIKLTGYNYTQSKVL